MRQIIKEFELLFLSDSFYIGNKRAKSKAQRDPLACSSPIYIDPAMFKLFLVLQNVVQAANVGQNLDNELVAPVQGKLGVAAPANASRSTGDTTGFQVRLRQRYTVFIKA